MGKEGVGADEAIKRGHGKYGESLEGPESEEEQLVLDISVKPVPAEECRDIVIKTNKQNKQTAVTITKPPTIRPRNKQTNKQSNNQLLSQKE